MPKLVPVTPSRIIHILHELGFWETRIRGSHHFFRNTFSGKTTIVSVHSNKVLGVGALKMILREINLSVEEYEKLRRKI